MNCSVLGMLLLIPAAALAQSPVEDLADVHGLVSLGAGGVVTEGHRLVLVADESLNRVDFRGEAVELSGRIPNGVVWPGPSTLAFVSSDSTVRIIDVESGEPRDFVVPIDRMGIDGKSDGSVWLRERGAEPGPQGVEWVRLDFAEGLSVVFTPPELILVDAFGDQVLFFERGRTATGGRIARILGLDRR